jgi:signal transduction histidine kinase
LQQVLGNILNNGTKFTERHGHISIATRDDIQGRVILTFKDDGIGMTSKVLSRLFEPFEQSADVHKISRIGSRDGDFEAPWSTCMQGL